MTSNIRHIIKYDWKDGVKLPVHQVETWCGHQQKSGEWLFQDAQHALLSIEQGLLQVPCKKCLDAIIKAAKGGREVNNILFIGIISIPYILNAMQDLFK